MRAIIQRVSEASVKIDGSIHSSIKQGLLVLVGFDHFDNQNDIVKATRKITRLRLFSDEKGLMNKSLLEIKGELLIVSQFTLYADIQKGNRPSFIKAASPEKAISLYEAFITACKDEICPEKVKTGLFGAVMTVSLINEGPVTLFFDSKK